MSSCFECGGLLIKTIDGQQVCSSCGLVHNSNSYEDEELKQSPNFLPTLPLGGKLVPSAYGIFRDFGNVPLSIKTQKSMRLLKILDDKLKTFEASTSIDGRLLKNMIQIANELNFSKTLLYDLIKLFLKSIKYLRSNGYNYTAPTISAAALLVLSRTLSFEKILSLDEVAEIYIKYGHRIKKGNIAWCASIISKKVLNKVFTNKYLIKMYINRLCKLFINNNELDKIFEMKKIDKIAYISTLKDTALKILEDINEIKIQGKTPLIFAAAILYMADKRISKEYKCKSILTHSLLKKVAGIPEFSIREHKSIIKRSGC